MLSNRVGFKKAQEELRIVYGEVYAPNVPDSDGDFMDTETIRKAAHKFMENQNLHQVDRQHTNELTGSFVVESFIARKGDDIFIEGSWVVGVHVPDTDLWDSIRKGEINGFSLEATSRCSEATLVVDIPDELTGVTTEVDGHDHEYIVKFDNEGIFLGGHTSEVNGHFHTIRYGTQTDKSLDHQHLFSFMERLNEN